MFRYPVRSLAMAMLAVMALAAAPSVHADAPVNPFAGSWAGRFTTDRGLAWGPIAIHIAWNGLSKGEATYFRDDLPKGVSGNIIGHVNDDGFGFYAFRTAANDVIPYLLYVELDEDGNLIVIAPVPWQDGFTVLAVLERQ
jgi:hypothetical protein